MANCMDPNELLKTAKDMDRAELIKKLEDLEDDTANFIDQLPRNQNRKPWTLDEWDEQIQSHPLFMTKPPTEGEEMPPLVEALQKLKYDPEENSANELAMSYKEDGNFNFKNKKYRWAVDSYTKGLEADCSDKELTVQLYSNRAAAHYYIGNYVKSLRDAEAAKSIKPDHFKALQRGAQCCFKLLKFQDCINWCQEGLKVCPDDKTLSELKEKAATKKRIEDRDKRMANILEERNKKQEIKIKQIFQERNIHFVKDMNFPEFDSMGPDAVRGKIQVDKDGKLVFPVMMLYPEYGTTDYIREFNEESNFLDHFQVMFDENDLPGWDEERKYIPQNLQVYFSFDEHLVPVKSTETLKNVLSHPRFQVTPAGVFFYITVSGSKFDSEFRSKYKICGYEENI